MSGFFNWYFINIICFNIVLICKLECVIYHLVKFILISQRVIGTKNITAQLRHHYIKPAVIWSLLIKISTVPFDNSVGRILECKMAIIGIELLIRFLWKNNSGIGPWFG